MPTITIQTFGGEQPAVNSRLLQEAQAVTAINCNLQKGDLEPLKAPAKIAKLKFPAKTIFKHDQDGWLGWADHISVIKSAVIDTIGDNPYGHLLITGDQEYPTQYLRGGHIYRLGIPRPDTALTATVNGGVDAIIRSSSYCYTYVQSLAGGLIEQESAPSSPTNLVDVKQGGTVTVTGFKLPTDMNDLVITKFRIYRTVAGNQTTDFRFLTEVPSSTTSYTDSTLDNDMPFEVLQTSTWDMIPNDAKGLIKTDNGLYACFRGNELLISEPFYPYVFPSAYRLTVEEPIVALSHVDATIVILTRGRPYLAQGGVPESLQIVHLPIEQSCVSADSVGTLPGGVVYASPDGLMLFTSSNQTLVTSSIYTREQWRELLQIEEGVAQKRLMGAVLDNRYIGFFEETNLGFILDLGRKDVVKIEIDKNWKVHAMHHSSIDDCIYLSIEDTSDNTYGVYKFEAGEDLTYQWKSKPFFTSSLVGMSAVRVEGNQCFQTPIDIKVFGPNEKKERARLRLTDTRTKRIRPMKSERLWQMEVTGKAAIYEMRLSGGVEDLERGN